MYFRYSSERDNFTDSIMVNMAITNPEDKGIIDKVINNYHVNFWKGYEQPENLSRYLDGETDYQYQGYTHYWGGWQIIWRPLLFFFDISDILVINYGLQLMLMGIIVLLLSKLGKEIIVFPFLLTIFTMMPQAMANSLQLSDIFYITLVGCIFMLWKAYRGKQVDSVYLF